MIEWIKNFLKTCFDLIGKIQFNAGNVVFLPTFDFTTARAYDWPDLRHGLKGKSSALAEKPRFPQERC